MKPKISIGTDIIEVSRFRRKPIKKNRNFYNSIFTELELIHCQKYSDIYPHLAGIFAAKEAVVKCTDLPLRISDIEISWHDNGKPFAIIGHKKSTVQISISHIKSLAMAVAVSLLYDL
jgi:holo-[acyl-carrier protein] synthase